MAVNVTLNGVTYSLPETGEKGWGDVLTSYLQAISTGVLTKAGGLFVLTQEADFGNSYGIRSKYYKSRQTTNVAASGILRLAQAEAVAWRNAANNADLSLTVNGSNALTFNGAVVSTGSALTAADVANVPSGNLTAVNVQAALNELQGDIDTTNSTLSAHTGASTGVHGVAGAVVGTTDTQVLTNKTLSGSNNTFSNIPNSATTAADSVTGNTIVLRANDGSIVASQGDFTAIVVDDGVGGGTVSAFEVNVTDVNATNVSATDVNATNLSASTAFTAPLFTSAATEGVNLRGRVADGALSVGVKIYNDTTLAAAGARVVSFWNNATEMGYFNHENKLNLPVGLIAADAEVTNLTATTATFDSGNPLVDSLTVYQKATLSDVFVDTLSALAGTVSTQTLEVDAVQAFATFPITFTSDLAAGSGSADFAFDTGVNRTNGKLLNVANNGVTKAYIDYAGAVNAASAVFTGSVAAASGTITGTLGANALTATTSVSAASASITGTAAAATLTASTATQSPKYKPAAVGQGMTAETDVTSGSGTVPFTINNTLAFNGGSDKLFSVKQNGTEAAYVSGQGTIVATTNFQSGNGYILCPTTTMNIRGAPTDGATAVGVGIRSALNLTTVGAAVAAFYNNNTTEVLAVTKDGDLKFKDTAAAVFGYNTGTGQFNTNGKNLNVVNGMNAQVVADAFNSSGDALGTSAYFYGNLYSEADIDMNGGAINMNGGYVYDPIIASASVGAVASAGRIRMLKNEGVAWRNNGDAGNNVLTTGAADDFLYYNGVKVVTETPAFLASISPKSRCEYISMEDWRTGATAPTKDTYGSAPMRISGWKFTTTNQSMELWARIPDDIDINFNAYLRLSVLLLANETVGDTLDWTATYVAVQSSTSTTAGDNAGKTYTQETAGETIYTGATTAGTIYQVRIPLRPNDANNPFSGDKYVLLMDLTRNSTTNVGDLLLLGACLEYTSKV